MKQLRDFENLSRAEICYYHLISCILIFKGKLISVVIGDNAICCELKNNASGNLFKQIYYMNIHERYKFIDLLKSDDEFINIAVKGIHKVF